MMQDFLQHLPTQDKQRKYFGDVGKFVKEVHKSLLSAIVGLYTPCSVPSKKVCKIVLLVIDPSMCSAYFYSVEWGRRGRMQ